MESRQAGSQRLMEESERQRQAQKDESLKEWNEEDDPTTLPLSVESFNTMSLHLADLSQTKQIFLK